MSLDAVTPRVIRSLSLYYKLSRRRYHRTPTKREVDERRSRFYQSLWEEAATAVGGSFEQLDGSLYEIRCDDVRLRVRNNFTSLDDSMTVAIAADKPLVYRLLTERGVPVPRHIVCEPGDVAGAWAFAATLGKPCVVKPARSTAGGIGITSGITGRLTLARAMAYAGAFGGPLLVEEAIVGGNYRLLYFDGELLDAVLRSPPTVRGDGRSSIEQLIAAENEDRLRKGIEACQSLVKIDGELRHTLRLGGRSLRSVPAAGEIVLLKNVVNDNRREDNESAAERLCPSIVDDGAKASAAVGARLAGVDVITADPTVPLSESCGAIIEVNTTPGYYYHYMKKDGRVAVATLVLQRLTGVSA